MDADLFDNEIDSEPFDIDDDRNLDNFEDETPAIEEAENRERTNPDSDAGTRTSMTLCGTQNNWMLHS